MNQISTPQLQTDMLDGIAHPSGDELATMQKAPYILRARDGKLTEIPAEKSLLPHDSEGHPQGANVAMTASGAIIA